MSDIYVYYLVAQLVPINDWFSGGWDDPAYRLELHLMGFEGLLAQLYGGRLPPRMPLCTRVAVHYWRAALRHIHWDRCLMELTHLWQGTRLEQLSKLEGFHQWDRIGITFLGDVYEGSNLMSLKDLKDQ